MARVFAILAIFVTIAAVTLSMPRNPKENEITSEVEDEILDIDIQELNEEKLGRAGGSLFNLSAYINAPGRPNGTTSLTFVPLITLLSALLSGNVQG